MLNSISLLESRMDATYVLGLSLLLSFMKVDGQNILGDPYLMERCPLTNTKELELLINSAARNVIISHLNMMETQMSKYKVELIDLKNQITEKMNNLSNDGTAEAANKGTPSEL
ncbi:uncharacterized protein LOC133183263 [Saccostrea echinata]|uniref:uncharacterized protein LOC133183263 n=1 Tax=Saccostrea echinata TaxID=191078 RepID=UPI002A7ECB80|nr:uncharacterized protein LOC133183263 [Saccostrea echinata]